MNIYNHFKIELGHTDVCNQYTELLLKTFQFEHSDVLKSKENLSLYSSTYNIILNDISTDVNAKITGNYIVNIHSSFCEFLERYKGLEGCHYADCRPKEKDLLTHIYDNLYTKQKSDEVSVLYQICNYYRLVRNGIIHIGNGSEYSRAKSLLFNNSFSKFKKLYYGELNAPNEIEAISFDDQVLFSKAAKDMAKHIYYDSHYVVEEYVIQNRDAIYKKYSRFPKIERKKSYLVRCLSQNYPIKFGHYDEEINRIIEMLK